MKSTRSESLNSLLQEIELEKAEVKKYIANSESMAATLRTVMEMYRLTGSKESQVALDKK